MRESASLRLLRPRRRHELQGPGGEGSSGSFFEKNGGGGEGGETGGGGFRRSLQYRCNGSCSHDSPSRVAPGPPRRRGCAGMLLVGKTQRKLIICHAFFRPCNILPNPLLPSMFRDVPWQVLRHLDTFINGLSLPFTIQSTHSRLQSMIMLRSSQPVEATLEIQRLERQQCSGLVMGPNEGRG